VHARLLILLARVPGRTEAGDHDADLPGERSRFGCELSRTRRQDLDHGPQTFSMDAQGFVLGEVPPEVMRIAAENRVAVTPLVVNRGFDQPLMHTLLDTQESRAREYLIYYALRDGYQGFQFDYENIHYTYRQKLTRFFEEAARAFHKHGLQLSAALVGRRDDTRSSNRPAAMTTGAGCTTTRSWESTPTSSA
jgi:spore germination protein YaaH